MTNLMTIALKRTDESASTYNKWIYSQIRPFLGSKILEIGCGIGNITRLLMEDRFVAATDMDSDYLSYLEEISEGWKNRPKIVKLDIASSISPELRGYQFDTVVCLNVLEHILDDANALRNIYQLLSPGGRLVLLVPAGQYLYNKLDNALEHYRRYKKKELTQQVLGSGFKLIKCSNFNLFGILGWWISGKVFKRDVVEQKELSLFDFFVPLFRRLEQVIPPIIGLSLICIAYRPDDNG
ncbi:MAG: methyltransferase [Candidatus Desantisbacteria bacterium]